MKRKTVTMTTVLACPHGDAPAGLTAHVIGLSCCTAAKVAWIRRGRMDVQIMISGQRIPGYR